MERKSGFGKIRELLKDGRLSDVAADFAAAQADEAARLRQMFLDVLDGMEVNQSTVDSQQSTEGENKFSLDRLANYTVEEYNERGWVVVNDVMNYSEFGNLTHQYTDEKVNGWKYPKSKDESMILVGEKSNLYSKLVFVKNTFDKPSITKVIDIDEDDQYAKSIMLQEVLEYEQAGFDGSELVNHIMGAQVCSVRTKEDYDPYREQAAKYKRRYNQASNQNNQKQQQQGRSDAENSGAVKLQKIRKNSKWLYQPDAQTDLNDLRENPIPFVGIGEDARLQEAFKSETVQVDYRDDVSVNIADLKSLQAFVLQSAVDNYREGLLSVNPDVIEFEDQLYLINGEEKVIKALMEGKKTIRVNISVRGDHYIKHSLRMADQTSPVTPYGRDTLPTFGEGKETAGGLAEEAAQMERLRHSLGIEAQNSRLTQKIGDYQQIVRQQDAEIRALQRTLTKAGVQIFANAGKVQDTAGRLLQSYGAAGIRGTERRQINDALAGLYNRMANEQLTRDALETEAGEIAEKILKQSKYMTPTVSDYSRAILDDVKSIGVRLSDAQKQEAAYRYGSYGAFYRQTFGKIKIRNEGVTLDQRWKELSEAYPSIFDATASDADQPALLLEAVNALQNDYIDDNGFDFDEAKE